jgi:FkbM family methyltransferase
LVIEGKLKIGSAKSNIPSMLRRIKNNFAQIYFDILKEPLNRGLRMHFLKNFLKWKLFFKHRNKRWKLALENGYYSYVYPFPDHDAGEINIWTKNVDYYEIRFIREHLRSDEVVYDIGCNVGNRTLAIADKVSGGVLVDAGQQAIKRTQENLALNRLDDRFITMHKAVGEHMGKVYFTNLGGASTVNKIISDLNRNEAFEEIELITVDSIVETTGRVPSFLKIDTEGNDFDVLKGAIKLIRSGKLRMVQFERLPQTDFSGIRNFLANEDWVVFALERNLPVTDEEALERSQNIFAVQKDYFKNFIKK